MNSIFIAVSNSAYYYQDKRQLFHQVDNKSFFKNCKNMSDTAVVGEGIVKRGRGRPPKLDSSGKPVVVVKVVSDRKRGRPPRSSAEKAAISAAATSSPKKSGKKATKYVATIISV